MVRFMLFILISVIACSPVHAEESAGVTQTVCLYDGLLTFPPPVWINSTADLDKIKVDREQKGNVFSLEQIPKDQEFGSWTRLHGVYGYKLPGYDLDRFFKESTQAFANGCKVKPKGKVYGSENGNRVMLLFCDELQDEWVVNGNNSEQVVLFFG